MILKETSKTRVLFQNVKKKYLYRKIIVQKQRPKEEACQSLSKEEKKKKPPQFIYVREHEHELQDVFRVQHYDVEG
jgi:hypothetical protein